MVGAEGSRRGELAANLAAVERRLVQACVAAGRDRAEVTLVAVTKEFPASDVELLAELGITDVAENRDQEARVKHAAVNAPLRWHYVGQVQRNKARSIARYADVVHSLDRAELVPAFGAATATREAPLDVLLQVSLAPDPAAAVHRGGADPAVVPELAGLVVAQAGLRLRGVMAVPPLDCPADEAFAQLAAIAATVRAVHPDARWISAGMSSDLEHAVRHGATHVRVGTALLGKRRSLRANVSL
ncbi:MAG TPA: YggS family pyridoxal phosphate-dependent enzyme [Cryptosporangiaceae bacterium]|nr:YggS family pyridoxal phosphate-dependent enzyme [Cryptosporangiaceae bacterium]